MESLIFAELLKGIDLSSLVDNDVDLKMDDFNQNVLLMSPPASDSGSQEGFSPYSIDSEPGSPLLDDAKVMVVNRRGRQLASPRVCHGQDFRSLRVSTVPAACHSGAVLTEL